MYDAMLLFRRLTPSTQLVSAALVQQLPQESLLEASAHRALCTCEGASLFARKGCSAGSPPDFMLRDSPKHKRKPCVMPRQLMVLLSAAGWSAASLRWRVGSGACPSDHQALICKLPPASAREQGWGRAGSAACHLASKKHQFCHSCLQEEKGELWPAACLPNQ